MDCLLISTTFEDPSKSNREWVSRLQNVVSSLNNEKTRLIGMNPIDAMKQTLIKQGFSQPVKEYEDKLLFIRLVSWRVINTKVKEGNDLLTLYGR